MKLDREVASDASCQPDRRSVHFWHGALLKMSNMIMCVNCVPLEVSNTANKPRCLTTTQAELASSASLDILKLWGAAAAVVVVVLLFLRLLLFIVAQYPPLWARVG